MEQIGAAEGGHPEVLPPPERQEGAHDPTAKPDVTATWHNPSASRQSTRGGSGSAAGSTPKKSYRPSASSRPRPAGKKPDRSR